MTKIFKHLAKHWAACLVIIALLLVQAYGDLTLPDYTSKIVDTGIQQSGIADAVPEVVRDSTLQAVKEGMHNLTTGSLSYYFSNCVVSAGAKTGTAETGIANTNNGVFVCFAPYDDPQIAVFVLVEHGGSGSELGAMAADILSYYFSAKQTQDEVPTENTLTR